MLRVPLPKAIDDYHEMEYLSHSPYGIRHIMVSHQKQLLKAFKTAMSMGTLSTLINLHGVMNSKSESSVSGASGCDVLLEVDEPPVL